MCSKSALAACLILTAGMSAPTLADENLFGYVKGVETLPEGAGEAYAWVTQRSDKGMGHYQATDVEAEVEYGFTSRFQGSVAVYAQAIDVEGILIDAYVPKDEKYGLRLSGLEGKLKYRFRSPLVDGFGLATQVALEHSWLDPHSGQDKNTTSFTFKVLGQKNFLDDLLVSVLNVGVESTYAKRSAIDGLPPDFEWPTDPEMEIELNIGAGLTYRFAPNWFAGVETFYETEFETEVGQERWSWHAGPTIHYGRKTWWATLTWMAQLKGGGEAYPGQTDDLHLIEKAEQEVRFKLGYNF